MILGIDSTLAEIGKFVNSCLAMLGMDFGAITSSDWATWGLDFAFQIVATIILFLLVRFKLWKPITNMLEARKAKIDSELNEAEKANADAQSLKHELEKQLADAQEEVKRIIKSAEMDGNARKEEIIDEAKAEAKRRLENNEAEIAKEVSSKQQEIKNTIVSVAFEAASKILEHEVDKDKYLELVNQIIVGANIK